MHLSQLMRSEGGGTGFSEFQRPGGCCCSIFHSCPEEAAEGELTWLPYDVRISFGWIPESICSDCVALLTNTGFHCSAQAGFRLKILLG